MNKIRASFLFVAILFFTKHFLVFSQEHQTITVFIHGTKPPTLVAKLPFVHNAVYTKPGLVRADYLDLQYRYSKIVHWLHQADTQRFSLTMLYLFGWNGQLSPTERYKAAEQLYDELIQLQIHFPHARLRLITHSHGGNVALNLASITQERNNPSFVIDELILLACPVQQATETLLNSKIFKQCTALYSTNDFIQVLDPQGLHDKQLKSLTSSVFSKRLFPPQKNLVQASINYNGRGILHLEFILEKFITKLPIILDNLDQQRTFVSNPISVIDIQSL